MTSDLHERPLDLGLAVFAVTAASYAQWSNPADDVPAYHPSAPLKVSALPPILSGAQADRRALPLSLAGACLPAGSQDRQRALPVAVQLPLRSRHWATPACAAAMRPCTGPSATSAPRRLSRLPADQARQDAGTDSRRHRAARVREHRPGEAVAVKSGASPNAVFTFRVEWK